MADDGGWLEFLSVVAPIALRAIGAAAASGDYAEAERQRQKAMQELNIPLPAVDQISAQLGKTNLAGVQANSQYTGAQDEALAGLKQLSQTGMSAQDQLGYNNAKLEAANTYSGMMGRNAQLRAARGQVGGGADTADAFEAASAGADRANRTDLQVAADAANRRYQALGAYGSMAERLRGADLAQKNLAASAQDRIDQFNSEAKRYGAQQSFNNQLNLANTKYGAGQAAGNQDIQRGQRTENTFADVGEGINRGASAYAEGQKWDDYLKKKYPESTTYSI